MKQLLIRNLKLRRWTLLIYGLLLIFFPFYHLIDRQHLPYLVISGPIGIILTIICLVDAGHLFRINRRLGGSQSYLFLVVCQFQERFIKCKLHQLHSFNNYWCKS